MDFLFDAAMVAGAAGMVMHHTGGGRRTHRKQPVRPGHVTAQLPPPPPPRAPGAPNICKALFVGINYYHQRHKLDGCVNDVSMMLKFIQKMGYPLNNVNCVILVDDPSFPGRNGDPTRANITAAFDWLCQGLVAGDTLFFHYSGHGSQEPDEDGDESDGYDETLVPVDYERSGQINDDEIFARVVQPLPSGVRMTALMDCCHSGTLLDLPYVWNSSSQHHHPNHQQQPMMTLSNLFSHLHGGGSGGGGGGRKKPVNADVIMFSACSDSQTSADISSTKRFTIPLDAGPGKSGGACTAALVEAVTSLPQGAPFTQIVSTMNRNLKQRGFSQNVQLSSSKPIDLSLPFSLSGPIQATQNYYAPPPQQQQQQQQ
eukprot:PhM_4_TR15688/c3_g1_i1/m.323